MISKFRYLTSSNWLTFGSRFQHCTCAHSSQHCHIHKEHHHPGKYVYIPQFEQNKVLTEQQLEKQAKNIYQWAKNNKVERYSFLAYPHTSTISQKQQSFLAISSFFNRKGFRESIAYEFRGNTLTKTEGDGSSFPSGGLRQTHTARGHMLWDHQSHLYIKQNNKILYIPSLLVTHDGYAQDDKTLYRQSEKILQQLTLQLLNKIGVQSSKVKIMVGFQQQFFVITKEAFQNRQDLKWLGRCLVGSPPARNQQLGQHYYSKIPRVIQKVLDEVEAELIGMGIPFKTRHNEVAVNQFQIACIFDEAGVAIDQNMITMQVLKEAFERHGLKVLLNEKPFKGINGSGKHANWNISYQKKGGEYRNLFKISEKDNEQDLLASKLAFILQLSTLRKHHRLYLSSIATPGNEIRLGGHQAPPRIFSAFLGSTLNNFLHNVTTSKTKNLRDIITTLNFDAYQDSSDRNRTSPYAYTGNRFQFRAVGSSQNPSYCMAVIAGTLASEIKGLLTALDKGVSLQSWMATTLKQSESIVFEGNGYSKQWRQQAKRRGIYVNQQFSELYEFLQTEQKIFADLGICSQAENKSRAQVAKSIYIQTVQVESQTLLNIAHRIIIPQAYSYLSLIAQDFNSDLLNANYRQIKNKLQQVVEGVTALKLEKQGCETLKQHEALRRKSQAVSQLITSLMQVLPKNSSFPNQSDFLTL